MSQGYVVADVMRQKVSRVSNVHYVHSGVLSNFKPSPAHSVCHQLRRGLQPDDATVVGALVHLPDTFFKSIGGNT